MRHKNQLSNPKGSFNQNKTLSNQIVTHGASQLLFQSVSEEQNSNLMRANLASPTFASDAALTSISAHHFENSITQSEQQKENYLKQITNSHCHQNKSVVVNLKEKQQSQQKDENNLTRKLFGKVQHTNQSKDKQSHQRLLSQLQGLQEQNDRIMQENRILNNKLKACQKVLESKLQEALKWQKASNSSEDMSNIDCFLEVKSFRDDFKKMVKKNTELQKKNRQNEMKRQQLQKTILAFTNKEDQTLRKQRENNQKTIRKYKNQIQEQKKLYQIKIEKIQANNQLLQKKQKRGREEYDKMKFLKDQIEKKRQQEIQVREDLLSKLHEKQTKYGILFKKNKQLVKELSEISKKFQEYEAVEKQRQKAHETEQTNNIKLQMSQLQSEYDRLHELFVNLEDENKELHAQNKEYEKSLYKAKKQLEWNKELEEQNKLLRLSEKSLKIRIQSLQKEIDNKGEQCQDIKTQFQNFMKVNEGKLVNQEEKHQAEITSLHQEINELTRNQNKLEAEVATERTLCMKLREDLEKATLTLQNTYQKIQEIEEEQTRRNIPKSFSPIQSYDKINNIKINGGLSTKSFSQLQMVRNILSVILKIEQLNEPCKETETPQSLISYIVSLSEHCADIFDELDELNYRSKQTIKIKQEVITKILKFAPEQQRKKKKILEYLRIMDDIENRSIQQINRINSELKEEWEQWNARLKQWKRAIDQLQQQNYQFRKLLMGKQKARREQNGVSLKEKGREEGEHTNRKYYY